MASKATKFPDMWLDPEDDPREAVPAAPGELGVLREYLDRYRLTLELKCDELTPEQLAARSVPPSTMSLLGLVRHMADVEHTWFHRVLQRNGGRRLFCTPAEPDADFDGATGTTASVDEAFAAWKEQIGHANSWLDTLDPAGLGEEVPVRESTASIRDILVHMVEEYARHCGHADLLRECIDGRTGQ
jgi:uncharacterized damage-inducible protein DinB